MSKNVDIVERERERERELHFSEIRKTKGITLVALIVTIIILLILAGISIQMITKTGIFKKAELAKTETEKKNATEVMNLKITEIQIKSYAENTRMPTLQEVADSLCEDNEMEYVDVTSKKTGSIEKIIVEDRIFTKLKAYPYEFEINSDLQLASINGVKISSKNNTTENCIYIKLEEKKRVKQNNNMVITLNVNSQYTNNLQSIEAYKIYNGNTEQIYKGIESSFEVTVELGKEYEFYAKGIYSDQPILLAINALQYDWQNLLELAKIDSSQYSTEAEALSNSTVLSAIKSSESALKYLSVNKELYNKVWTNDKTVDDEMVKVGIVPKMTSFESPSPFKVTGDEYNGQVPYYAFDKNMAYPRLWHCPSTKPNYIEIDLGVQTRVSSFSFTTPDRISACPKDFSLQGSNDGENWTTIKSYTDFSDYTVYETTLFVLDKTENYRYYRFWVTADNGYGYVVLLEIQLFN